MKPPSLFFGRSLILAASLLVGRFAAADTIINFGSVNTIAGVGDLDLTGEMTYAINFSANDPVLTVSGVSFKPDTAPPVGATFVGPNNVTPWETKPDFGAGADDDTLEQLFEDIRWAAHPAETLEAHLPVTVGQVYKLQVLFYGNHVEDRKWDIEVEGELAVDEVTSLGVRVGDVTPDYSPNAGLVYTHTLTAADAMLDVRFVGNLPGSNDDGAIDRNAIWQALTVEHVVADADADGLPDAWENLNFGNLSQTAAGDPDADGLPNTGELQATTNPNDADSDDDGLNDGVEVNTHRTNPKAADSDGDGLTDPAEINTHLTNPNQADSDFDGLTDFAEINTHTTNPTKQDTDGDGYDDGFEIARATNPKNVASFAPPQAKGFSGGDVGEGLDLDGTFIAAARFGTPGQAGSWAVRNATFLPYDMVTGLTEDATTDADNWLLPTFATAPGATTNDINLGEAVDSISYGAPMVNISVPGLTIGRVYKVQVLFGEQCCDNRGFDVYLEDLLVANEFAPGPVQGGRSGTPARAGAVVAAFVAADTTMDLRLDFTTITTPALTDSNAIINALTVEELPVAANTDNDGLPDAWEQEVFGNLAQTGTGDSDSDGLTNAAEYVLGSKATDADSDDDGLNDSAEVTHRSDPWKTDSDGDGLLDGAEVNTHGSSPSSLDSDRDTLLDAAEVNTHQTKPGSIDSDNDGFNDPTEILNGSNPNDAASKPGVSHVVRVLGGDSQAEGLDLDGTFLYAFNVGTPGAGGQVRDATFTDDAQAGITYSAANEIPLWHQPNFGDTDNDNNLEFIFQSIRWVPAPATLTVSLEGLTMGSQYKLQLLFGEQCCANRGFDLNVEGVTVIDDFSTATVQLVQNHPYAGGAMVHSFTATDTTLDIELNGNTTTFGDKSPILSGVTLEKLTSGPATADFAITQLTKAGTNVTLNFRGKPTKPYAVDFSSTLAGWTEVTDAVTTTAGGTGSFTDTNVVRTGAALGHYRVRDPVLKPAP